MFVLIDKADVLGRCFQNNFNPTGTQIVREIPDDSWPNISGQPANKKLCRWNTDTSRVVLKTDQMILDEYRQKQFKDLCVEVNNKSLFIIVKKQLTSTPSYNYATLVTDIKQNRVDIFGATSKAAIDTLIATARTYYSLDSFEA